MAEGNGAGTGTQADLVRPASESPIERVRARTGKQPPAGERGQTKSAFQSFIDWIGDPNPNKLSVETLRKMDKDPQVRAGIALRELAVTGKAPAFNYKPQDKAGEEKAHGQRMVAFLTHVWANLLPSPGWVLHNILSARRFGFAVMEKVWASQSSGEGEPVLRQMEHPEFNGFFWIERLKLLPPESLETAGLTSDEFGRLIAVHQTYIPSLNFGQRPDPERVAYSPPTAPTGGRSHWVTFRGEDLRRLIVYSANYEDGKPYGTPDLEAAYNAWYAKQMNHANRNILLERLSGTVIGEYADVKGQEALEEGLENIGPGAVLTVPQGSNVQLLEGWEGAVKGYQDAIEYDDNAILRALLVPGLTAGGAVSDTGSYARAQSQFDVFLLVCRQIQLEVEELFEEHFVKPLIDANFGPQLVYPTFDFPPLQEKDRTSLMAVWAQALDKGIADLGIDAEFFRAEVGLPGAPEGHVFQRPEPASPFGAPGEDHEEGKDDRNGAARQREVAARAIPGPGMVSVFERAESPAARRALVDLLEARARASMGEVIAETRARLLAALPEDGSPEQLARLSLPEDWLTTALDGVARDVLTRVLADAAQRFDAAGQAEAAAVLRHAPEPRRGLAGKLARLAGKGPPTALEDALVSYYSWATQMNAFASNRTAAELANRLRERILQAYQVGATKEQVAAAVEAEFATYTRAQVEAVAGTTIMDLYNSARNTSIDAVGNLVQGVKMVPLLDTETTPFCRALAGRSIARTDVWYERLRHPPYWYECRTTPVPILAGEEWAFDTDWHAWVQQHERDVGGGFIFGMGAAA